MDYDARKDSLLSEQESELIIYREKAGYGSGTYPVVSVNGTPVGQLRQGGYLRYRQVGSGRVQVSTDGNWMMWPSRPMPPGTRPSLSSRN